MIGHTVSHYTILEKLGAGGMEEVYRAEDTNLNRQVATKVLPDVFMHDTEQLARFKRRARLWLLEELKRGQRRWIRNAESRSNFSVSRPWRLNGRSERLT